MGGVHFDVDDICAHKEGTVGWIACRVNISIGGGEPVAFRNTVVVHEDGAFWRIIHWQISIPVANEVALCSVTTTSVDELLLLVQDGAPRIGSVTGDGAVTIMFTDTEGSTALMESLGEDRWLELLDWHDRIVEEANRCIRRVRRQGAG